MTQASDDQMREALPLSLLNDFLYCPRRAALKIVEGWRSANQHTERGDIVHDHTDLAVYEVVKRVTLLRALPVWSDRLGLNGKCDIVEVWPLSRPADTLSPSDGERDGVRGLGLLLPVEYKVGKRRRFENDDAQLCAQAFCLEEMFNVSIPRGAIFHADSKRRREVEFSAQLRARTEAATNELHALLAASEVPTAVFKPACEECSLYQICLPRATENIDRMARVATGLFRV